MSNHTFVIKEKDWMSSKQRTIQWESRVNIIEWIHDYVKKEYRITIKTK